MAFLSRDVDGVGAGSGDCFAGGFGADPEIGLVGGDDELTIGTAVELDVDTAGAVSSIAALELAIAISLTNGTADEIVCPVDL